MVMVTCLTKGEALEGGEGGNLDAEERRGQSVEQNAY